jgi:hypothetical protein
MIENLFGNLDKIIEYERLSIELQCTYYYNINHNIFKLYYSKLFLNNWIFSENYEIKKLISLFLSVKYNLNDVNVILIEKNIY